MKRMSMALVISALFCGTVLVTACSQGGSSFSTLPAGQAFQQAPSGSVNSNIDILWVIDNSSSMTPLQTNLVSNFQSFITQFQTKGFDFHMAVTTTDAYLAGAFWDNNPSRSVFRDGLSPNFTGVFDILSTTPNLSSVFVTNASQGANGSGDERAFASIQAALGNSSNTGFLRSDSFFAIIILSDEDDFSDPTRPEDSWEYQGGIPDHDYADPNLMTVDSMVSYLDGITSSTGSTRRYSVSSIAVLDSNCLAIHQPQSTSSIIGQRYIDIGNATSGILGSICDASYANSLLAIQQQIIELGTQFYLSRIPIVSTIVVIVNNQTVPQDPNNGWTYNSAANSIVFHGTAVPAGGSSIQVDFDPESGTF
jgi:hypothetical protein